MMTSTDKKIVVVIGATGRQGSQVVRYLLKDGWHVRAMTRHPDGDGAKELAKLGAELAVADLEDGRSLETVFQDAYGVYNVQNPIPGKIEIEISQGKTVAEVARKTGIRHLVYGSAGPGTGGTGVEQWDAKVEVKNTMQAIGLPLTVLRPLAFMELMVDRTYYPQSSTWYIWPKLTGGERQIPWISVQDVGAIAAKVFANPEEFIGQDFALAADVQSLDQCRVIYKEVMGKDPPRFPMPMFLFQLFVGKDVPNMWRWLRTNEIALETTQTLQIHPEAMTVKEWLEKIKHKL